MNKGTSSRKSSTNQNKSGTQTALFEGLVEVCQDEVGAPTFLIYNDGKLKATSRYGGGYEGACVPPPKKSIPWLMPRAKEVMRHYTEDSDRQLFDDIEKSIRDNSELPSSELYPVLAAWVMHTHVIEKFNYSPIICFYAVAARGKTRTCRTLLWMARRGYYTAEVRSANIIRLAERFESTIFFDVMDLWKSAKNNSAQDFLIARYERGIRLARAVRYDSGGFDDTDYFSCFGPTLVATNEPTNSIMESRCVLITMLEANRTFEHEPQEKDFLSLRERCVAFRARWMSKSPQNSTCPPVIDWEIS